MCLEGKPHYQATHSSKLWSVWIMSFTLPTCSTCIMYWYPSHSWCSSLVDGCGLWRRYFGTMKCTTHWCSCSSPWSSCCPAQCLNSLFLRLLLCLNLGIVSFCLPIFICLLGLIMISRVPKCYIWIMKCSFYGMFVWKYVCFSVCNYLHIKRLNRKYKLTFVLMFTNTLKWNLYSSP